MTDREKTTGGMFGSESARKAVFGSFFGTALEAYDFLLYGSAAGLVRSDALVALPEGEGMPVGVFAVGCRNAGHFEHGQGTELIAFLAHVTRYAVGRWWAPQL